VMLSWSTGTTLPLLSYISFKFITAT
jgi:hypothetical protein